MKELKKMVPAGLILATCAVTLALTVSAIQADPPMEPPAEPLEVSTWSEPSEEDYTEELKALAIETNPEIRNMGEFRLTAYCTCEKCCGQWADGLTYTGTVATPGRTVAVDPDVIPLGSTVYINGAEYIAEDIGGVIKGGRIDVLFATHQEALEFGVQKAYISIKEKE